jgi:3-hydroxyisobutyrate dehydrogenase
VREVAAKADVLFVALSSMAAYWHVVSEIAAVSRPSCWVLDVNTLSPDDKRAARERLSAVGWTMLDCTFSGNADMVERDLHSFYFSGDGRDAPAITPVLADLGEKRFDMGEFGNAAQWNLRTPAATGLMSRARLPRCHLTSRGQIATCISA